MNLSNELITQFVKATKDTTKTSSGETVNGTTVEYNGKMYVKLDGSDLLTPVTTTADVVDNERVTVLIKDHSATITGNTSSPAARTDDVKDVKTQITEFEILIGDKVSTEELEAQKGRIDELVSDNIVIREKLTAAEAEIDSLVAEDVAINGKLTAQDAEITRLDAEKLTANAADIKFATIENLDALSGEFHSLESTYGEFQDLTTAKFEAIDADIKNLDASIAEIDTLYAKKADVELLEADVAEIDTLYAKKADVELLEADVAEIDTLIFGSASGSSIQTSFANAVIAQLGDAQIKSAMIDTLSADKINAGDINTNTVRVVSEDGRLVISDETIQISDSNRVRVQIGKDASDDYSINIWDSDGKLMFSEGGITDSAIKEAIIRNNMVANDANIEASKLDISSLFTEINNSKETINAGRVLIDVNNQTLDVAFTTMTSDLDSLEESVNSQGTQLTVIQGQIASKVWQEDIDTATNAFDEDIETLSTQYSTLEQTVDGLSSTVSEHTTAITSKADSETVDALETRVTTAETKITQNTEQIALKATKTEVTETLGGYYTKEEADAAIKVSADEIAQSVSKTYATVTDLNTTNANVADATITAANAQADVDALETRVTTAETKITQNTEQIALKATKTEVTETLGGYYTKEEADAAISVKTYEIASTVEKTIRDIQIGGRNYFARCNINNLAWATGTDIDAPYGYLLQGAAYRGYSFKVDTGESWTLYRTNTTNNRWGLYWFDDMPAVNSLAIGIGFRDDAQAAYEVNYVAVPDGVTWGFLYLSNNADEIPDIMLEKGNKATDWSPAPEDIESTYATKTDVTQTAESITSTVSATYATKTELSTVSTTANNAQSSADAAKDSVDTLGERVTVAETAIEQNTEAIALRATKTELSTVSTVASNAQSAAEAAQSTADTAKTDAANAQADIDNLEIGGRNYFARCNINNLAWASGVLTESESYRGYSFAVEEGEEWTVYRTDTTNNRWAFYWLTEEPVSGSVTELAFREDEQAAYEVTKLTVPEGKTWCFIYLSNQADETPNIMLEKGNRATDWTPAPEDMATADDINSVNEEITSITTTVAALDIETDNISASVTEIKSNTETALDSINNNMETLTNEVSTKMSSDAVDIKIQTALDDGVSKVTTTTGFTFNDEGLSVRKSGSEMMTQITEDGMTVYQNDEAVLVANNQGVDAKNLHATTYLIIGGRSRFENYGEDRTGCFWIGG